MAFWTCKTFSYIFLGVMACSCIVMFAHIGAGDSDGYACNDWYEILPLVVLPLGVLCAVASPFCDQAVIEGLHGENPGAPRSIKNLRLVFYMCAMAFFLCMTFLEPAWHPFDMETLLNEGLGLDPSDAGTGMSILNNAQLAEIDITDDGIENLVKMDTLTLEQLDTQISIMGDNIETLSADTSSLRTLNDAIPESGTGAWEALINTDGELDNILFGEDDDADVVNQVKFAKAVHTFDNFLAGGDNPANNFETKVSDLKTSFTTISTDFETNLTAKISEGLLDTIDPIENGDNDVVDLDAYFKPDKAQDIADLITKRTVDLKTFAKTNLADIDEFNISGLDAYSSLKDAFKVETELGEAEHISFKLISDQTDAIKEVVDNLSTIQSAAQTGDVTDEQLGDIATNIDDLEQAFKNLQDVVDWNRNTLLTEEELKKYIAQVLENRENNLGQTQTMLEQLKALRTEQVNLEEQAAIEGANSTNAIVAGFSTTIVGGGALWGYRFLKGKAEAKSEAAGDDEDERRRLTELDSKCQRRRSSSKVLERLLE